MIAGTLGLRFLARLAQKPVNLAMRYVPVVHEPDSDVPSLEPLPSESFEHCDAHSPFDPVEESCLPELLGASTFTCFGRFVPRKPPWTLVSLDPSRPADHQLRAPMLRPPSSAAFA